MTSENLEVENGKLLKDSGTWGIRHLIGIFTFLGYFCTCCMRFDLSIAIVAMTKSTKDEDNNNGSCSHLSSGNSTSKDDNSGEFDWDSEDQGIILGSFFWGYVATQFIFGLLTRRFNAKFIYLFGVSFAATFHMLIPIAARTSKTFLIICRILQGMGEGAVPAASNCILAKWSVPQERTRMGALLLSGIQIASVITLLSSGLIIDSSFGWPGVFYIFGGISLIWCILWYFIGANSPDEHPWISFEEKEFMHETLRDQITDGNIPTPWKAMLTSMPFLAILVAQVADTWGLYTLLTALPTYMANVLKYDIGDNALLSALPYFCMYFIANSTSFFSDYLRSKKILSTTAARKIFNTIAGWGAAGFLIAVSFSGCNRNMVIVFLTIGVAINGKCCGGHLVNFLDIAPNFCGIMMSFVSTLSNIGGIISPYLTGIIIQSDEASVENWRWVFLVSSGVYFFGFGFYLIFASGDVQYWNQPKSNSTSKLNENE